jgi:hypothetical protein
MSRLSSAVSADWVDGGGNWYYDNFFLRPEGPEIPNHFFENNGASVDAHEGHVIP